MRLEIINGSVKVVNNFPKSTLPGRRGSGKIVISFCQNFPQKAIGDFYFTRASLNWYCDYLNGVYYKYLLGYRRASLLDGGGSPKIFTDAKQNLFEFSVKNIVEKNGVREGILSSNLPKPRVYYKDADLVEALVSFISYVDEFIVNEMVVDAQLERDSNDRLSIKTSTESVRMIKQ